MNNTSRSSIKICAVSVTYGDRREYLSQMLKSLDREGIDSVVIFNNGCPYNVGDFVRGLDLKLREYIIDSEKNVGSAVGFHESIERALDLNSDLYLLIDDDNTIEHGAGDKVKSLYAKPSKTVSMLMRADRTIFTEISRGKSISSVFPHKKSCVGLDIIQQLKKRLVKSRSSMEESNSLPYVPYSGMLIPFGVALEVGLPRKDYFLYSDDTEYSLRINAKGYRIELRADIMIEDVAKSWHLESGNNLYKNLVLSESKFRIYYYLRNQLYTEIYIMKNLSMRYVANFVAVILIIIFYAFKEKHINNMPTLFFAVRDGIIGKLGFNSKWPVK